MGLSNELITQFAKITTDKQKTKTETTVYGTVVEDNGLKYVKLDGSGLLTPVTTTASTTAGDRVTVLIKNHKATVTGNLSSPSAKNSDLEVVAGEIFDAGAAISQFENVIAGKVDTTEFNAEVARIDELASDNVTVKQKLTAAEADIDKLQVTEIDIEKRLTAAEATILTLEAGDIDVESLKATFATVENLNVVEENVSKLTGDLGDFEELAVERLDAVDADISDLETNKLDAGTAAITYANIDFANISTAAIETFFSKSGMIEDVVVSNGTITGQLVGVTIKGELIEAGTLVADKLVIQGSDGLYYKLNTTGVKTEAEQTDYNSLNGSIITAKSITASKISVNDLVAFGATIGGFHITNSAIYSGAKTSVNNGTRGTYLDNDGQMAIGDNTSYIRYYKDSDGTYKLAIVADDITLSSTTQTIAAYMAETNSELENLQKVADSLSGYYTKEESDAKLTIEADAITSSVANTYATKTSMNEVLDVANAAAVDVEIAQETATDAQTLGESNEERVAVAETLIQQLSDSIAMMVTDSNGESLMVQTEDGWTFSTAQLQDAVNNTSEQLDTLTNTVETVDDAVSILQQAVSDLGVLSDYVKITTYESEPCIELGETDSDFKLLITNTRILFLEGSNLPAYISNQALNIKNAVIEDELQQGGFVWSVRSNGNMGLIWKGVSN